jgi:Right handed beta helix region/Secretion system C-terminal sorting domain
MRFAFLKFFTTTLLLALLVPMTLFAAYTTPGTGITWTLDDLVTNSAGVITLDTENDRYVASDTLIVAATDTVNFTDNYYADIAGDRDILVYGLLTIVGTETDSVFVTGEDIPDVPVDEDGAGGIRVDGGAIVLKYAVMLASGNDDNEDDGILLISGATGEIENSRFTGWMGNALRASSGTVVLVDHCLIVDNLEYGIVGNLGTNLTIKNSSLIRNNQDSPLSGKPAISIGTQGNNTLVVDSCYIVGTEGNRLGGISIWNLSGEFQHATITNTIIMDCAFGINVQGGGAAAWISGCTIMNNNAYANAQVSGSGISITGTGRVYASHNAISGNHWGMTIPPSTVGSPTAVVLGKENPENIFEEGFNFIAGNGNGGVTYEFYQTMANTVHAVNNYWGTTDLDSIESVIYHQPDNEAWGEVIFAPVWDAINVPQIVEISPVEINLVDIEVGDEILFDIHAINPVVEELSYSYMFMGNEVSTADTALITFDTATDLDSVVVTVTNGMDVSTSHTWYVTVTSDNSAPVIVSFLPEERVIQVGVGEETVEVTFSITATDVDEDSLLTFEFFVSPDGEVNTNNPAIFEFDVDDIGSSLIIEGWVFDTSGASDSTSWSLEIVSDVDENGSLVPTEYALNSYPNPFNAQLSLNFALPQVSDVKVDIFSIEGRLVNSMDLGQLTAGHHMTSWNAQSNASGVYFVKFSAGSWQTIQKVVLVR